jgi:hypothetical protein
MRVLQIEVITFQELLDQFENLHDRITTLEGPYIS